MSDTLINTTAARLFRDAAGEQVYRADLWSSLRELGFVHIAVPERLGGGGMRKADTAIVVRHAAANNTFLPLAETMVAGWLLADQGIEVPSSRLTVATRGTLVAEQSQGDVRISGKLANVPWLDLAEEVLTVAKVDGQFSLFRLQGPFPVVAQRRNLADEPRATLHYEGMRIPHDDIVPLADPQAQDDMLLFLAVLRAAQLVGAMQRALDIAIEYANVRVQFGRPIGRFQAIQHSLAEAVGHYAAGLAATEAALAALDEPGRDRHLLTVAAAKARTSEAATHVAAVTHQVLGAIGFTREHELQLSTRRLWSWREEAGDEAFWNERLGRLGTRLGSGKLWALLSTIGHAVGEAP